MPEHTHAERATALDRDRVERVLWSIWAEYRRDFQVHPINEIQDLRAFSVLWAAVFVPEAISPLFQRSLTRSAQQYRERADYGNFCWFRVLPLEAALYALTGDEWWLSNVRANLDHQNSSLRTTTIESLALLADRVEFDAETLRRIARNLEMRHFFCEWPVILFAVSKESSKHKRRQLEQWLQAYEMNPSERTVLEMLARGEFVENPFLHLSLRIQQYLTLRMACAPPKMAGRLCVDDELDRIAAETADDKRDQMNLFAGEPALLIRAVWGRLGAHPLTASLIRIGDQP